MWLGRFLPTGVCKCIWHLHNYVFQNSHQHIKASEKSDGWEAYLLNTAFYKHAWLQNPFSPMTIKVCSRNTVIVMNFFFNDCVHVSVFDCAGSFTPQAFLSVQPVGLLSSWRCAGVSLWWLLGAAQAPGHKDPGSHGPPALEHRPLLCGTWNLPRSGIEPVSLASVGRLFTTEPPGKKPVMNVFCSLVFVTVLVAVWDCIENVYYRTTFLLGS